MRRFPLPPGLVSTGTVSVCQQVMQIPEIGVMQSYPLKRLLQQKSSAILVC